MPYQPREDFWPKSLAHLGRPFVTDSDERVVVAEITGEPDPKLHGVRMLFTALVPLSKVAGVLKTPGGIGHGVESNGPHPCVGAGGGYRPSFWIKGPDGVKFETLVHTWLNHNKTVLCPDNGLLMCYGLVPRQSKDGSLAWDDPRRPVYDVLQVAPLSRYSIDHGHTTARITIRRDYLEDYLSLTGCAAVVTYFEERYSSDDPEVEKLLVEGGGSSWELPGRQLWIKRGYAGGPGTQLSQVWGCALLLAPKARPISEEREEELIWPDRAASIRGRSRGVFGALECVYVRDDVLTEYEGRDEFEINPCSGSVSYDGWWSVSFCDRIGRNHIRIELRKLYEGAPFDVVKHFNRFAVKRTVAEKDRELNGTRNIGQRANELVDAFLELTATLARFSDAIGLVLSQEDIGKLGTDDLKYKGWWTIPSLKALGHVVPLSFSAPEFLSRCKEVFKLFENLASSHLRQILIRLGIPKEKTKDFQSLKLLTTLCQLATVAVREGFDLSSDFLQICAKWNSNESLDDLRPLFALSALRVADAHLSGSSTPIKVAAALEIFGIDENGCRAGWGKAVDAVYDQTIVSLRCVRQLIESAKK